MATDADEAGFLSRWSRRKAQVRQGQVPVEPVARPAAPPALPAAAALTPEAAPVAAEAARPEPAAHPEPAEPAPTLADVALLTPDSDYSRFVASGVQPEVKNAALGKLFSDPHFNVMDGLDTYIDDYGKPDPLPAGWLRQMAQSRMLGLFDDEEEKARPPQTPPSLPVQAEATAAPTSDPPADENTDLQLQPDDDAGRPGPAPGAVEDIGRAH